MAASGDEAFPDPVEYNLPDECEACMVPEARVMWDAAAGDGSLAVAISLAGMIDYMGVCSNEESSTAFVRAPTPM